MTKPILAAQHFRTNAEMMAQVAKLWIDLENDEVLDPTFGKGGFWKKVRPRFLTRSDLNSERGSAHWDFRDLPLPGAFYDVVTFDPTYVVPGGKTTTTIPEFHARYGMDSCERTGDIQWVTVIVPGAHECHRVLKPGGLLMWKGQPYVSSGSYQNYQFLIMQEILSMGMEIVDVFVYVRKAGSIQDKNRTKKCKLCRGSGVVAEVWDDPCPACERTGRLPVEQQHARNNYSFLIIARKART